MRSAATFLAVCATIGFAGCGARTGFDDPNAVAIEAGAAPAQSAATDDFCAFRIGPVASRDIPSQDGPVTQCVSPLACVNIGGQWLCCHGPGPHYDGMSGSCAVP